MPRDEVKELCGDVGHVFDRHFFQRTFPKSGRLWQQHNLAGKALRHLQFEGRLPNVIIRPVWASLPERLDAGQLTMCLQWRLPDVSG